MDRICKMTPLADLSKMWTNNVFCMAILINWIAEGFLTTYKNFLSRYNNSAYFNIDKNGFGLYDSTNLESEYDFIIVGSGSAGSVIASRLSEVPEWKVLLLEAGEKATIFNEIPIIAPVYQVLGDYNWNYTMERQPGFCLAMEDQLCAWPRGKALGGSTILNYMIYSRGHPKDYENWNAESPGWAYDDVLPYYLKSENCKLGTTLCDTPFHNSGGLLSVEEPYYSELTDYFIAAGKELGYSEVDYNSDNVIGFSKMQANQKYGRRHNVAIAFLNGASSRDNLNVIEMAKVRKILIDPDTKAAYGVEFSRKGRTFTAKAGKDIVLSAGVLNSPQLLMLSGIGPKHHLAQLGISPIIQDLPVGRKLYDHISFPGVIYLINKQIEPPTKFFEPLAALDWLFRGRGFWTSLGGMEAIAYISSANGSQPDIELLLNGIGSLQFDHGTFSRPELRITREVYKDYFKPLEGKGLFSIFPVLLHPKSLGSLKLRSKDPDDAPLCYGNYLTDPDQNDLNLLLKSIRFIQKLVQTTSFGTLDPTLYDKSVPGCENFIFDTDSYWECAIRHVGLTLHHQISTCKMGQGPDAVVDTKLRVHGVKQLRVADTSVIPVTLSAHTSAPAMMIGERAADIIKIDYGK